MSEYLDGKEISLERLRQILRKATIENKIFPVLQVRLLKNKGVQLVLDAVAYYLPSPLDIPPTNAIDKKTGQPKVVTPDDNSPFTALAFKTATDPFRRIPYILLECIGQASIRFLCFEYHNGSKTHQRIVRMHANDREEVKEVYAGNIAAA